MTNPAISPIGLTSAEARERLAAAGYNELPGEKPRSFLATALAVLREPMFVLLVACVVVYVILGEPQDALMLGFAVLFMMAITIVQERRTEKALAALRTLAMPIATVMRDGARVQIPSREVVPGDVMLIHEGDRVVADGALTSGNNVAMDESLLTGESVPVEKTPAPALSLDTVTTMPSPGGTMQPFVFAGTLTVQGSGLATVMATGVHTAMGAIGAALGRIEPEKTRIQIETARVVKIAATVAAMLSVALAIFYGLAQQSWLQGVLAGLTLAMGLLPEELPVVLIIFLGIGAWRIAQHGVLARRSAAIEMLGAITVLCVDKTGTLTENQMALAELSMHGNTHVISPSRPAPLPDLFHDLVEYAILASHRDPFDPMEKAILQTGRHLLRDTEQLHGNWKLVDEYALSPQLLAMSRVWQSPDADLYTVAAKGAPEAIADLCHLDKAETEKLDASVRAMASRGLRVLGVARAMVSCNARPARQHDFDFAFCGLIALADPLRPNVPAAIGECQRAGIRVKMITGDYPATALNIAAQARIDTSAGALTGSALDAMDDASLQRRAREVDVFCRITPQQKLRLVEVLKDDGEIVAMTGDGVNDAPALKAAHVGVAMGKRGTDVAREAAAMVLLEDDFASLVASIAAGRRIFTNLRKAFAFLIATHIPIAGIALIPVALGMPMVLLPIHIMFLELVTDPACSIVFEMEPAVTDSMKRPPHRPDESLFDRSTLSLGLAQGAVLLIIVLCVFLYATGQGFSNDGVRTITFVTIVLANISLLVASRGRRTGLLRALFTRNHAFWVISAVALVVLTAAVQIEFLRSVFRFAPMNAEALAICGAALVAALLAFEGIRRLARPYLT